MIRVFPSFSYLFLFSFDKKLPILGTTELSEETQANRSQGRNIDYINQFQKNRSSLFNSFRICVDVKIAGFVLTTTAHLKFLNQGGSKRREIIVAPP